jgi:hypothetical protein
MAEDVCEFILLLFFLMLALLCSAVIKENETRS